MWEPVAGAAGLGEERCLGALDVNLEEVDSDHAVLLHQVRDAVCGEVPAGGNAHHQARF